MKIRTQKWWLLSGLWLLVAAALANEEAVQPQTVIHLPLKLKLKPIASQPAVGQPPVPATALQPKPSVESIKGQLSKMPQPASGQSISNQIHLPKVPTIKPLSAESEPLEPKVKMARPPKTTHPDPVWLAWHAKPRRPLLKPKSAKKITPKPLAVQTHSGRLQQAQDLAQIIARSFGQSNGPYATVISCADRPATEHLEAHAGHKLFVVYAPDLIQAFNQSAAIEQGVRSLATPVLMWVGQTQCQPVPVPLWQGDGAPHKAVLIPKDAMPNDGPVGDVLRHLNEQVDVATLKFSSEVEASRLAIVGAFYDANNVFKHGAGQLILVNLNGETTPKALHSLVQKRRFFHYRFMNTDQTPRFDFASKDIARKMAP